MVRLGLKKKCSSDLEILDPFEHVFESLFGIFGLFYDGSFGVPRGVKTERLSTPEILDPFMQLSRGLFWPLGMPLGLPLGVPRALERAQGT